MNNGRHDDPGVQSAGRRPPDGDNGVDVVDVAALLRRVEEHRAALAAGDPGAAELQRAVDDAARLFAPAVHEVAGSGSAPSAPRVEIASWVPTAENTTRRVDKSRLIGALYRWLSAGWRRRRDQLEVMAATGADGFSTRLSRKLGRHTYVPYVLTACATSLAVLAGLALVLGQHLTAAVLVTFAGLFELVDAAAAKQARDGRIPVLFDYVADRLSDLAIVGAVALAYADVDRFVLVAALAALTVSFLSSYARAQAEALLLDRATSLFGRAERFILIVLGYWLALAAPVGAMQVSMVLAGAVSLVTLVERLVGATHSAAVPPRFRWEPDGFLPRLARELGQPPGTRTARRWTGHSILVQCHDADVQDWRVIGVIDPEQASRDKVQMKILKEPVPLARDR